MDEIIRRGVSGKNISGIQMHNFTRVRSNFKTPSLCNGVTRGHWIRWLIYITLETLLITLASAFKYACMDACQSDLNGCCIMKSCM